MTNEPRESCIDSTWSRRRLASARFVSRFFAVLSSSFSRRAIWRFPGRISWVSRRGRIFTRANFPNITGQPNNYAKLCPFRFMPLLWVPPRIERENGSSQQESPLSIGAIPQACLSASHGFLRRTIARIHRNRYPPSFSFFISVRLSGHLSVSLLFACSISGASWYRSFLHLKTVLVFSLSFFFSTLRRNEWPL